jgi:hypothetical protein
VEKTGDQYLDQCNGRVQPDGTYGYHATSSFPYILGCYVGTPASEVGGGDDRGGGGGGDGGGGGGGGPTACDDASDCPIDECPPDSIDCTCAINPEGVGRCAPTCSTDDDCPTGMGPTLTCDVDNGWCIPEGGAP